MVKKVLFLVILAVSALSVNAELKTSAPLARLGLSSLSISSLALALPRSLSLSGSPIYIALVLLLLSLALALIHVDFISPLESQVASRKLKACSLLDPVGCFNDATSAITDQWLSEITLEYISKTHGPNPE